MKNVVTTTITTRDGKKIKIKIDRDLCIGAATCVALAARAFALDEKAKATTLKTATKEKYQAILAAAKSCPVTAIFIEDEKGKQIFP